VREWLCRVDDDYQDRLLACGATIVAQLRVRVLEETQFTCSAGIPHNKVYNGFVICGKPKHAHVLVYEKTYVL
jgi:hypothetical protein